MATANSLSYPQGEDGACVERDEVLDINTEKSKNKQTRGCFGCISETAFFDFAETYVLWKVALMFIHWACIVELLNNHFEILLFKNNA